MAGSIYLRFGPNGVSSLSANQWAPAITGHDPNPPLPLEDGITFRLPLVARIDRRGCYVAITSQGPQNTALLVAPAASPFAQLDWTNPASPRYPVALRTWTWSMGVDVLGQRPLVGPDQPNPRGYQFPVELRTFIASMRIEVLAQAPLVRTDWPLPPRARAVQQPEAPQNLLSTLLAAPQAVPVAQYDWPNPVTARRIQQPERLGGVVDAGDPRRGIVLDVPRGPTHPVELRTQAGNLLESTLSLPPGTPVPAYYWPLPGRAQHPIGLRTWAVNLLQSTLNPGDPLRPLDWPLPGRALHPVAARTWTCSLLQSTLRPQDPPAPIDWPLPVRRTWQPPIWAQNLLESTLFPGNPIRGVTPPNPILPRRSADLLTWITLPVPGNIPVVAPGVFGWGARGRVGIDSARDPWSRIGTDTAVDENSAIGTDQANGVGGRIGSDEA